MGKTIVKVIKKIGKTRIEEELVVYDHKPEIRRPANYGDVLCSAHGVSYKRIVRGCY